MKNFFAVIVLVLTTAFVSGGLVFWFYPNLPKFPNSPNSQSQTATTSISDPYQRFFPGLEKLNNLYRSQSELLLDSYFVVDLKGKIKSISSNNLTIEASGQEYSFSITAKDRQFRFFTAKDEASPPKPISLNGLQNGNVVKVQLRLNSVNGNTSVLFVTKVVK